MASYYLQPTLGNVDVNFCDLAKLPKPPSGCLTKKQWNELQQWTQQYGGSVRQNTTRNFSTKDKPGTWPLNLYDSAPLEQHSVDFDVLLNEDIPAQQDTSTTHNVVITQSMYVVVSRMYKPHSALNSPLYYKTIRGRCWRLWQWWVCQNSLSHPGCCRSAIIYHFWRITCHPKRNDKWGSKQHYSCWQWNYWNRWGGVYLLLALLNRSTDTTSCNEADEELFAENYFEEQGDEDSMTTLVDRLQRKRKRAVNNEFLFY